jgi:membrane fusion protein, multidrug efflux system
MRRILGAFRSLTLWLALLSPQAMAQPAPGGPPAVGVVRVERQQITETEEFIGRIQAVGRISLVARVTAFLDKRNFIEGSEIEQGDLLYVLEQAPFKAEVNSAQASIDQYIAQHRNAQLALERARTLLTTPAGQQSTYDAAFAAERALAAQIAGAQAQLETAQINLGYTEIRAPIAGRISSTAVTEGNVVSPTSGTLATIVSQDPVYVLFPVAQRTALDLRSRYGPKGGFSAVVLRLRLPDGRIYGQTGHLDYVSPTVAENTDTLTLRGVVPNPRLPTAPIPGGAFRELTDGEFVTVMLEGVQPVTVLAIPRAAVLADQQGDYVYVVDAQNKAEVRRIQLGQSTPASAVIFSGLKEGETVISEGVQRVRPGQPVSPSPATPPPVDPQANRPAAGNNGEAAKP